VRPREIGHDAAADGRHSRREQRATIVERFKVPEQGQVFVAEAALRRAVRQILVLTTANLRGVETHGVSNMLRAYVRDYKAGKLDPRPGKDVDRVRREARKGA
jgi:hypothetical protein